MPGSSAEHPGYDEIAKAFYVTDDKIYCIYIAPNEAMVREHARQGGFPANRVSEVRSVINPTTAE